MNMYELKAVYGNRKSYYGKATIKDYGNLKILQSYTTNVCYLKDGIFHRTWHGWSSTTARHVDEFRRQNGLSGICKKEWESLPVEKCPNELIEIIKTA